MKYLHVKSQIGKLYLRALRGHFEQPFDGNLRRRRYFYIILLSIYAYGWSRHNLLKHEFDLRKQPNFLIPKFVYKARREHYIYFEQSRLARGLSTTFSYYDWDPVTQMVCYTSKKGDQKFEKSIFNRERMDIVDNPLFEEIFRSDMNPKMIKRGSLLVAYELNRKNRYDLDNYLHYKAINPFDLVRAIYYQIYVKLGLTNKYRYDHFISKPDYIYDIEKIKLGINGMDRLNYFENINKLIQYK